jgi:hypothetical protein
VVWRRVTAVGVMKWFHALPAVLCTLPVHVEAQDSGALLHIALETLPKCAVSNPHRSPRVLTDEPQINCLVTSVSKSTCELTDFYCIAHDAQLNAQMEICVQANCTIRESLSTSLWQLPLAFAYLDSYQEFHGHCIWNARA